jgi:hypothetical protein
VRVRLLVGQVLSYLTERQLDGDKLAKQAQGLVSEKDVAAAVAALHFVLTNAGALPTRLAASGRRLTRHALHRRSQVRGG